ncbi:hypothetical protein M899_0675 [Bacteriovorax sp. BSW11_IV]|uniref:hypothetical protein n=1 Tax=Bacteriovorax sp. BSW11_IV TaxID=1353529 RepID=UPI00038A1430|nr:hypothetical protein [Bacteriovorax sp. BSW11_IV]EQC49223.1 hypothetical protein M899_0675 [Bacteriovorax sp. BSW11_IV]
MKIKILFFILFLFFSSSSFSKEVKNNFFGLWKVCFTDFSSKDVEVCKTVPEGVIKDINFEKISCDVSNGWGATHVATGKATYFRSIGCYRSKNDVVANISVSCMKGEKNQNSLIISSKSSKDRFIIFIKCESV